MKGWLSAALVAAVVATALASALAQAQAPAAPAAAAPATSVKLALVDVQRILARSAAGVAAREQLERDKATMQKEMDGRRVELEKLREELDKKGALMNAEARRDKADQFERKTRDFRRMADDFQKELVRKEELLLQKLYQEMAPLIERVGKQRGYQLILERQRSGALYLAPEVDLTDEIIRVYDQESGPKGKK